MGDVIESFSINNNGIDLTVNVVCYNTFDMFEEQWKLTDRHEGGVTIKNKEHHQNSYKFAIPLQYSLAELSSGYAKQGRANASRDAYASLQKCLMRDLNASDYGFHVSASVNGITLLTDEPAGFTFDYSYFDSEQLIDVAKQIFKEFCLGDLLSKAKFVAKEIITKIELLKQIVA